MKLMRNVEPSFAKATEDRYGVRSEDALRFLLIIAATCLIPLHVVAENINGAGASLNLATTDLASSSAQTSGAGGRLLWASAPGRGVVSVNGAGAKGILEPLHAHGVSGTFSVDFSADPQTGDAPLEVRFTDLSKSGVYQFESWVWDFGDGSPVSYEQNPLHVYEETGVYTVTLTVTTDVDALSATRVSYVTVGALLPAAGFPALLALAAALALAGLLALRRVQGNKRGRAG